MVDISGEFWQAVMISWSAFAFGVWMFQTLRRDKLARIVSRGLIALSPAVLTCYGAHAVRVNEHLAMVVEAKRAEGVSHGGIVQLAATEVVESRAGGRLERHVYTDGRAGFHRSMPPIPGRIGRGAAVDGFAERANWQSVGPILELPKAIGRGVVY
jgi:hypothetical protein